MATADDLDLLTTFNRDLIEDEGHADGMDLRLLRERMQGWIQDRYRAVLFHDVDDEVVGYALYLEGEDVIHLRQFFICREHRRRGFGTRAVATLRGMIWPTTKRLTVDALVANTAAVAFWRKMGYSDYSVTLEIAAPLAVKAEPTQG